MSVRTQGVPLAPQPSVDREGSFPAVAGLSPELLPLLGRTARKPTSSMALPAPAPRLGRRQLGRGRVGLEGKAP